MSAETRRVVAVCGATGLQGGAVTRSLLERGHRVRALTRNPTSRPAQALATAGADVVRADMEDPAALRAAFDGVDAVYSVQNGLVSGFDREFVQGVNVAEAAKAAGVAHIVYGSAGPTAEVGVPSWDVKRRVEDRLRALDVAATILRPMAFMELMTEKKFYPAVATWRIMPKLAGENRPFLWIAVDDFGRLAASVIERPDEFIGRDLAVAADVRSVAECRAAYREVYGRPPSSFPMPMWLLDRFTRGDLTTMWRWLVHGKLNVDTSTTKAIVPDALSVHQWMITKRAGADQAAADKEVA